MNILTSRKWITFPAATLISVLLCIFLLSSQTSAVSGSDFRAGRIIDDSIFYNSNSMTTQDIQTFLNSKVPNCDTNGAQIYSGNTTRAQYGASRGYPAPYTCLKDYSQNITSVAHSGSDLCKINIDGGTKSAAQIIKDVSVACGINPQVLIVMLQKEMSLVTDDWPWPTQYDKAMGYACPDSGPNNSANCDRTFFGFFNQVYNAAKAYRRYEANPNSYNYKSFRNNFILYNPNTACGGSNIYIENQATASLYIYTPYQPNTSALNNLYGTGDSCGAYGNRNFWRMFNDWFGPTTGEGFALMTSFDDNGDSRQWVVYKGIKRHVPSVEILRAWKLDGITPIQTSGLYLGSIPTSSQPLDRLMRPPGTLDVYFVDNGMSYRISSPDIFAAWGLNPAAIVDVSEDLGRLPANQGDLTFSVRTASDPRVFFMDGGVLRHIQNGETLEALEGVGTKISFISQDYYSRTAQAEPLSSPRVRDASGNNFIISNRTKLTMSTEIINLFPWSTVQVNAATLQRMDAGTIEPYIRAEGDNKVYLIDQQQKHHITDPNVLSAWQSTNRSNSATVVSRGITNLISNGSLITDYFATNGTTYYLIDKNKKTIPLNLVSAYTGTRSVYTASQTMLNLFSDSGSATNFVKSKNQPQAYLLTNSGILRHITSTRKFSLWVGTNNATELEGSNMSRYNMGEAISAYVSDGVAQFVMSEGKKTEVSLTVNNDWKLTNPGLLADGTLNNFVNGGYLVSDFKGNGQYHRVNNGVSYMTVDKNIADIWGVSSVPDQNTDLAFEFLSLQPMTRFVKSASQNDSRLFVVSGGSLFHLSPAQALNLGISGSFSSVHPESISKQPISLWNGIVVRSGSSYFVIDGGSKRPFTNSIIFNHWTSGIDLSQIQNVGNGFINFYPTTRPMERAIKGSGIAVYSAQSITKRWIRSTTSYVNLFAPYTTVSDSLINTLPSGDDIN